MDDVDMPRYRTRTHEMVSPAIASRVAGTGQRPPRSQRDHPLTNPPLLQESRLQALLKPGRGLNHPVSESKAKWIGVSLAISPVLLRFRLHFVTQLLL